jgi:uncharacterized membrane protein
MNDDPKWRTVLNWSAVITFFSAPFLIFILQIIGEQSPWFKFEQHIKEFAWLGPFYTSVTALVFGLAGLNSWDRRAPKNESPPPEKPLLPKSKHSD